LGVISAKDLGLGVHIKSGDSSASVSSDADLLVLEEGGDTGCGMSFLSGTASAARIMFGDSGDNDIGMIKYAHDDNSMILVTNTNSAITISSAGEVNKPLNPCFAVYASVDQVVDNTGGNTIVFGGETTDIGANFASNVFTAPIAGKYRVSIKMLIEGLPDGAWVKVTMRPVNQQFVYIASGNDEYYFNVSFTEIFTMSASDTFDVQYVSSSADTTIKGASGGSYKHTSCSGQLIQ